MNGERLVSPQGSQRQKGVVVVVEGWGGGGRHGKEDAIAALAKRDIQSWGFVRTLVR